MKKTILLILTSLAFSCTPDMPKFSNGLEFSIMKSKYEDIGQRQEVRVQTNQKATEEEIQTISEWVKKKHSGPSTFIIFFVMPGKGSAYARVDYEPYKYEEFQNLE